MNTLEEGQHAVEVVLPLHLEMVGWRSLPTRQLRGQLQAVGEEVVEVLHAVVHQVPLSSIADACTKCITVTEAFPTEKNNSIFSSVYPRIFLVYLFWKI